MRDTLKEHLKRIGSLGGKATSKKYGKDHYQKMVSIRENKKHSQNNGFVKPPEKLSPVSLKES